MSQLEPRIETIRLRYELAKDDFWELPQKKGTWIAKHSALEVVSAKAGIWWTDVQVVEADSANGIAVMIVKGTLDEHVEWATGEASPKNNKNAYPWAMAEKRAKDRVILKLVGLHGLVYSEDEAEDFKAPKEQERPSLPKGESHSSDRFSKAESRKTYTDIQKALDGTTTLEELKERWISLQSVIKTLPKDWEIEITSRKDQCKRTLEKNRGLTQIAAPNFDNMQSGDALDEMLQSQGEQE